MVLWEITLATAYFLGLKRTFRLALKIQRRIISSNHPKIRQFAHRRTRAIFDIAVKVHQNIQERDIEVGRNLGNWILRWLDKMKPSANIRGLTQDKLPVPNTSMTKQAANQNQKSNGISQRLKTKSFEKGSDRYLFSTARNSLPKSFSSVVMMMRFPKLSGSQYRQLCVDGPQLLKPSYGRFSSEGVIRKDITLWMQRN